ncbi:MAG TPA: CoA ester lyase [Solirubrobacteraceae bacterium]|nr:CoA ester lyase [Solirubrobacteraceae bacterium]
MTCRRAVLVVPAAPAARLEKGRTLEADEVVIDLEDAVVPAAKDDAREVVVDVLAREFVAPLVAVRVNAIGTPWCHLDLAAVAGSAREHVTVVLPKVEGAGDLAFTDRLLAGAEAAAGRTTPVRLLALIETAAGLQAVGELASARLDGLILGYADLAASLGRDPGGPPEDWRSAQDALLVAARAAGIQAIDGPHLAIRDDEPFRAAVAHARALCYDGKWSIHPAQLGALREAFTPTEAEVADARETLAALERAASEGAGAVAAGDRMLDEALAVSARRVLARAGAKA